MKRILKAITGILAVCSFTVLTVLTAGAAETGEAETKVSFTVSQDGKYSLSVEASGNGEIRDGEKNIRNGIVEYQLSVGETKIFRIVPDEGYRIGSVIYEQPELSRTEDLTQQALSGEIQISMESTGAVLRVEFVPDTSSGGGEGSQGQTGAGGFGADAARTGDTSRTLGYMAALAGAGLVLAYLSKKNKKEQQSHLDKHM